MDKTMFYFWVVVIAVISFFTGEIATFMMLFLILITLREMHQTLLSFYHDWKSKYSAFVENLTPFRAYKKH
ncbi:hypothetical protein [Alkalihalobacillus sp. TS-13]|uniref:hypothetical protein n=1 Tax=Alkalihalobacillus sp. TS-13 TaxID=2842455 RepID=UPI001C887744|nr:hypothetical protein [Alkalihalobacillus sp. TS-13]